MTTMITSMPSRAHWSHAAACASHSLAPLAVGRTRAMTSGSYDRDPSTVYCIALLDMMERSIYLV